MHLILGEDNSKVYPQLVFFHQLDNYIYRLDQKNRVAMSTGEEINIYWQCLTVRGKLPFIEAAVS